MTATSQALHVVYLLAMLRVVQKTRRRSPVLEGMNGFFWQMLTGEYAHLLLAGNVAAVLVWLRRVSKYQPSRAATWLDAGLVSTHGLLLWRLAQVVMANVGSAGYFRRAFIEHGLVSPVEADKRIGNRTWAEWWSVWNPLPFAFHFPGTMQTVTYGWVGERLPHALQMDVYRHKSCGAMPPVFLFIHGGGWVFGSKTTIPSSLLHAVAEKGWLFCAMDYRKAPFVSFPDHLIDCKRAVAYLRSSSRSLQADTSKLVVCGESAGGHLASLLAITAGDKSFQPGFEDADCSVLACVDAYGTHDLTDRCGYYGRLDVAKKGRYYVEAVLMNSRLCMNRPAFERASPLYHLLDHKPSMRVPPFLCVHGTYDSVIPFEDSREFFQALQRHRQHTGRTNAVPDMFIPVPHAEHAFNAIRSLRTLAYNDAVCVFLDALLTTPPSKDITTGSSFPALPSPSKL